ncbi:MAG: PAS domain S-box protein [Cytophagales bacterium]|nr:MAG: PAS domain S-box protein [Cytophagales bacterium]
MNANHKITKNETISYEEYLKLKQDFEEKQIAVEERLWLDSTISQFDNLLRLHYSKSTEDFAKVVLQHIAETTNAFMGVLYVYDKESQLIIANASYACKLDKITQIEYQIGEGVIGQAAESKKMIRFDNVPYKTLDFSVVSVKISTANMLVMPLIFNEEVYGVIELMHLKPIEEKYVSLLNVMCKNIASMLESIFNNALTKKLLAAAQQQNEALSAQEEELRQNMEEIQSTQEEMYRKQARLDAQMEALNDSSIISVEFSPEGLVKDANPTFYKLFGYEPEEIQNQHHSLLVTPEEKNSQQYQQFWENLRNGIKQPGEYTRVKKDGEIVVLNATYSPVLDRDGNVQRILKFAVDVSPIKKLLREAHYQNETLLTQEEELRQNMEELQSVQDEMYRKQARLDAQMEALNDSSIINVEFSPEGIVKDANPAFYKLFGYEPEEIQNQHHSTLVSYEERNSQQYQQFWENLRNGIKQPGEYTRIKKDGEIVILNATYSPMLDKNGNVERILKFATDITEIKYLLHTAQTQEEELRQNMEEITTTQDEMYRKQARLDAQMEALNDSSIIGAEFSPEGIIKDANPAFYKLFGYEPEEIQNQHHSTLVSYEERNSEQYQQFWENLRNGIKQPGECVRVKKNGDTVILNATYSPVLDKNGNIERILKFATDITEIKHLLHTAQTQEEELRQNMEEISTTQDEMSKQMLQIQALKQDIEAREKVFSLTTILSESDLYGNIIYANEKLSEISQYTLEELIGQPHNMLRHPDMPASVFRKLWQTIKTGKVFKGIIKNRKKDGSYYWVQSIISPVLDEDQNPTKYIGARYIIENEQIAEELYQKMLEAFAEEEE